MILLVAYIVGVTVLILAIRTWHSLFRQLAPRNALGVFVLCWPVMVPAFLLIGIWMFTVSIMVRLIAR